MGITSLYGSIDNNLGNLTGSQTNNMCIYRTWHILLVQNDEPYIKAQSKKVHVTSN
jgi:hypothetical protein